MLDLGIDLNLWPWVWLGVAVFFAVIELTVLAGSFVLLPFAVSALAAALLGFYDVAIEIQWLVFVVGGGEIYRDSATGEPTGILKDAAIRLLDAAMPKPTPTEQAGALRLALRLAASRGVTSVQDITDWGNLTWSDLNLRPVC